MNPLRTQHLAALTRRQFLDRCQMGIGSIALSTLLAGQASAQRSAPVDPMTPRTPHFAPRARRIIYLHMSGGPPQQDLFDPKPRLKALHMKPCPEELLKGQKFAFIKGVPKILASPYEFARHGQSGIWISEMMPHLATVADELCVIRSMKTDQFNHAPAELLLFTGSPRFGGASMGSWVTWGLGSESSDLPGFVVLVSGGTDPTGGKALWGSGFLPSVFQGVQCRTVGDPILYASNPDGMDRSTRRRSLDALRQLNEHELSIYGDPETLTRIQQYELAYRMQMSVPQLTDLSSEPQDVLAMYGATPGRASFANNCVLARRMIEQGVRYVQLFDWGWDIHGTGPHDDLVKQFPMKCRQVDQPIAALIRDLKARGLLEDTLVIWGGEFGRTPMNEARNGSKFLGRDHHPHCFTLWMAGAGVKPGHVHGETDELGYFITDGEVQVHDLQATILHLLGFDPYRLSFPYQGLNQRLIGPSDHPDVVTALLA